MKCPVCGSENGRVRENHIQFCLVCGSALSQRKRCPHCQRLNLDDAVFCEHCGGSLKEISLEKGEI